MGLFASRPEEPEEWAGIPSEPLVADTVADRLPDAAGALYLGGLFGGSTESVVIPVVPPAAPGTAAAEPESDAG